MKNGGNGIKFIMNSTSNDIDGSFKMSELVLNRIYQNSLVCNDVKYKGISNYELILLVKLTQICSVTGYIRDYRLLNIKDVTGCKRRNCYYILEGLKNKGFITYTKSDSWVGHYDIKILNNDFSNVDYKKAHYLNMNKQFFTGYDSYFYSFCNLSLNAKKLFLMISHNYRDEYGYTLSFRRAAERLQIKEYHIKKYIEEINHILPINTIKIEEMMAKGGKTRLLYMKKECILLRNNKEIAPNVLNYFKNKIITKFDEFGIIPGESVTSSLENRELSLATRLYNLCTEYMKKGFSMETVYNVIIKHCKIDGIVQLYTFTHIRDDLASLIT